MEGSNEENQKLSAEQRQEYEDQLTGLKKEIDLLGTHLNKLQVKNIYVYICSPWNKSKLIRSMVLQS